MAEHATMPDEAAIRRRGLALIDAARRARRERRWPDRYLDSLLAELLADPVLRVAALRFVDVLPALASDRAVVAHLLEYFGDLARAPALVRAGLRAARIAPAAVVAPSVRKVLQALARRFLGGADLEEALATVHVLGREGKGASLDLLGEVVLSEAEAEGWAREWRRIIDRLAGGWPAGGGWQARPHVSLKVSSLASQLAPEAPQASVAAAARRLRPLLLAAREAGVGVCLDMEHYELKGVTLAVFQALLDEPGLRDWDDASIAVQAYLRETPQDLERLIAWARARAAPVGVRLVRGAYWDREWVVAAREGWAPPVWAHKADTDAAWERALARLAAAWPAVRPIAATHNVRSLAVAMELEAQGLLPAGALEVQMLYGMAPALQQAVVEAGARLRIYVPFGELVPGMAYLVRRLLENASSQSPERLAGALDTPAGELLAAPGTLPRAGEPARGPWLRGIADTGFRNEPHHRFTDPDERDAFARALAAARDTLGREHPLIIGGEARWSGQWIDSLNPAHAGECVGRVAAAGAVELDHALDAALAVQEDWAREGLAGRAAHLERAAELLAGRRDAFAALQILEAGKTWREADADVTEAVDFLRYYAAEARRLAEGRAWDLPGEENRQLWRPRGVAAVIPPWNFPLAILTGMLAAAAVAGNPVVLKPSSQTPVIAAQLVGLLADAGWPPGVVQFLPGRGSLVGEALVRDPRVALVAFTGSREVGLGIVRQAAVVAPGQRHVRHVVAEMGGKNAIVIDEDADLDEAVAGVVHSAFGYQGQKCSACSRAIVLRAVRGRFVERLVEATRSLPVGDPADPWTRVGPVIERAAVERLEAAIAAGRAVARPVLEVDVGELAGEGFYVGPTVFVDVPPSSALACEELFGPVLAVMEAADLEEAFALANATPYALTAGLYSRSPASLRRAAASLAAGNVYLNRGITGARVGRQPFGGYRLSGLGTKAGGPDYLQQFMVPVCVTENTLRRGFAPPGPPS